MRNRKATGENVPIDRLVDLFKTGKATFFTFTVAQLANERKSNLDWSVVVPAYRFAIFEDKVDCGRTILRKRILGRIYSFFEDLLGYPKIRCGNCAQ